MINIKRKILRKERTQIFDYREQLLWKMLHNKIDDENKDGTDKETGMLILAACFHDIGMSYREEDKEDLLDNLEFKKYLENNHSEYIKVYGGESQEISDEICRNFFRSNHHVHIYDVMEEAPWDEVLNGKIAQEDLILVCKSHGEDSSYLNELEADVDLDLRMCAVLLRLADILDFDTSRAPKAVYAYCGFTGSCSGEKGYSKNEWEKHISSNGFNFKYIDREKPYELPYSADCKDIQVEQAVQCYLDWVDRELRACNEIMKKYNGNWSKLVLPLKIERKIKAHGYVSGQFHFTLNQKQVLELLVGKEIYKEPMVFVRELIQNAIDAVRTREKMDCFLPSDWKPQINIRYWVDRFGIGILSCFLSEKLDNRIEVSTKRISESRSSEQPALRLKMSGINGYYYMADQSKHHKPGNMKGTTKEEQKDYLANPGTVIAVRTNLYQFGSYNGFKEIVDKYVIYPLVPIHYEGIDGIADYMSQDQFMKEVKEVNYSEDIHEIGKVEFELNEEQIESIKEEYPEIVIEEVPKLTIRCVPLDIVLLKDNFRPNVELSREGIQSWNLNQAIMLQLIKNELIYILNKRKLYYFNTGIMEKKTLKFITVVQIKTALAQNGIGLDQIKIKIKDEIIFLEQVKERIIENNSVDVTTYFDKSGWQDFFNIIVKAVLYQFGCATIKYGRLDKEYSQYLKHKIDVELWNYDDILWSYGFVGKVFIFDAQKAIDGSIEWENVRYVEVSLKKKNAESNLLEDFPPYFFAEFEDVGEECLAYKESKYRYACNIKHRFSVWLIKEQIKLQQYVPGIYNHILQSLMDFNMDKLINEINNDLEKLRKYGNNLFSVDDSLKLKECDFFM